MKQLIYTFFTGIIMGASDIVPGVSGGTIAFISGIYQRLIDAIASLDKKAIRLLSQWKIQELRKHVDGAFLLSLGLGLAISLVALASVMKWALGSHTSIIYSFFMGLVIASAALIAKNITKRSRKNIIMVIIGLSGGYIITKLVPGSIVDPARWMIMGSAAIGICAMILPGISGSFLLLIMGMYEVTLTAVHDRDIQYVLLFITGAVIGLLTFVRIVRRAFTKHHNTVVSSLLGLMLGSLPLLFPWKVVQNTASNTDRLVRLMALALGIIAIIGVDYTRAHLTRYEDKK